MTGVYLIRTGNRQSWGFETVKGTLIKNHDIWFGVAKSREKNGGWVITELTTGLKATPHHMAKKSEAIEMAKSESHYKAVSNLFNNERYCEQLEGDKRECLLAYDRMHRDNPELLDTGHKIWRVG